MATTTVLFIHGTGAREESYRKSFEIASRELRGLERDLAPVPCYWGHLGAKLLGGGKSIPRFHDSGGAEAPTPAQLQGALWDHLYADPLYELRILSLRGAAPTAFGSISAGDALREKVLQLRASPLAKLKSLLADALVDDLFAAVTARLTQDTVFLEAMRAAGDAPGEYQGVVARAIVARLAEEAAAQGLEPHLDFDLQLRAALVDAIQDELGGGQRGLLGLTLKAVMGFGGQRSVRKRRGRYSDLFHPFLGDIMLYQTRGEQIRTFLKGRIADAGDGAVIIAHSLGGIMCADLLIANQIPNVKCLITVGSQAPLLYELNSLHSLGYSDPLPDYFSAPWVNIYDVNDFLSYVGGELFGSRIVDVPVDNGCTFPDSHSMYWSNPQLWAAIAQHLPE